MQREFESSFKPYPATSLLHATHFYFLAIFSQLFENSACHLPLVLAHVTRSESKETTTVLIKQLHLHAMSLCAFTVLNFGLCFVVVVVAVVVVVVVVAVVVVVVVLLLFLLLFAVLACIHYRGNVSLRPPLHASTFYSRTVVSMFGRRCHLLVHALSSLQVANAKCMTLRSLALVSAQRAKNTGSQQEKNIGTEKNTFGSRKKTPCSGKKLLPQRGKTSAKNPASQREKFKAARKNTLQQQKSTFAAEKMHSGGSGKKPPEAGKNASEARKKPAEAGKKPAAEKVQLCNPKSRRNGKNTFPQREKAAALAA